MKRNFDELYPILDKLDETADLRVLDVDEVEILDRNGLAVNLYSNGKSKVILNAYGLKLLQFAIECKKELEHKF